MRLSVPASSTTQASVFPVSPPGYTRSADPRDAPEPRAYRAVEELSSSGNRWKRPASFPNNCSGH